MNWEKLKEKFPNSYKDIREFSELNNIDGETCMRRFLSEKGFYTGVNWMPSLKQYEKQKHDNIQ